MDEKNFPDIFDDNSSGINYRYPTKNKLERSQTDSIITGVCAALGRYLKIDAAVIRIIGMLSLLLGEWSIAVYFTASLFIPLEVTAEELSHDEIKKIRIINSRTLISGLMMTSAVYIGLTYYGLINRYEFFIIPDFLIFPLIFIGIGLQIIFYKINQNYFPINLPTKYNRTNKKKFLGVCGGFADYIGADSNSIRYLFIIFTIVTLGLGILIYLLFSVTTVYKSDEFDENEI